MARDLDELGYAKVMRDPETGELIVDTDSLRRADIGRDGEVGADPDGDDFGARSDRRRRRVTRRLDRVERRDDRLERREDRLRDKLEELDDDDDNARGSASTSGRSKVKWGMTAVGGTNTLAAAGTATVRVRLQHHFKAEDVTFSGSASGATVTSISFGDRPVWSNPDGIAVDAFAPTGMLRGILRGQNLRAGLDIVINGELTAAGTFAVTITGWKPVNQPC